MNDRGEESQEGFLGSLQEVLEDSFQQYWLAASEDGIHIHTGGRANTYTMMTFALELLKKIERTYIEQGIFSNQNPMIDDIRNNLREAMDRLRRLRTISHEVQDIVQEKRNDESSNT